MADVILLAPGLIILFALGLVLHAVIVAEGAAQPVLAQARLELFGDDRPGFHNMTETLPPFWRWRKHRNYPAYVAIFRQEQAKFWTHVLKRAAVAAALIGIALL